MFILYVLCYDRIDISEGVDVNKTSESKNCPLRQTLGIKDCKYYIF